MLFTFIHRRPLLRALLALALFVGLLGTAATHVGLTSAHAVAAAIDAVSDDVVNDDLGASAPDDTVSAEDNAFNDTLDLPDGLTVPRTLLPESPPVTAHAVSPPWHASSELRPPIV